MREMRKKERRRPKRGVARENSSRDRNYFRRGERRKRKIEMS